MEPVIQKALAGRKEKGQVVGDVERDVRWHQSRIKKLPSEGS